MADQIARSRPRAFPICRAIAGLEAAIGRAGFYKHERPDLLLMRMPAGTKAAGVFTTNAVGSAPTDWCKQALAATRGSARGLLVNAGCANSFTGPAGDAACKRALTKPAPTIGVEAARNAGGVHRRDRRRARRCEDRRRRCRRWSWRRSPGPTPPPRS